MEYDLIACVRKCDVTRLMEIEAAEPGALECWRGSGGETLLFHATESAAVRFLLDVGVDPKIADVSGRLPHHEYCTDDRIGCLETVLDAIPKQMIDCPMEGGITALHICAFAFAATCAESLLRHGADTECTDEDGFTALTNAVIGEAYDVARVLVSYGANPLHVTSGGHSCIDFAKEARDERMIEIISTLPGL